MKQQQQNNNYGDDNNDNINKEKQPPSSSSSCSSSSSLSSQALEGTRYRFYSSVQHARSRENDTPTHETRNTQITEQTPAQQIHVRRCCLLLVGCLTSGRFQKRSKLHGACCKALRTCKKKTKAKQNKTKHTKKKPKKKKPKPQRAAVRLSPPASILREPLTQSGMPSSLTRCRRWASRADCTNSCKRSWTPGGWWKVGDSKSESHAPDMGVPQGSVVAWHTGNIPCFSRRYSSLAFDQSLVHFA